MKIGIILQDHQGKTIVCNNAFAKSLSSNPEEMVGKFIHELAIDPVHEDGNPFIENERPTYRAIKFKRATRDLVMGINQRDGSERIWLLINADPLLDENGNVVNVICSAQDISERKRAEERQMKEKIRHQRQLTQAAIDGQEKEREQIGRELHDNIGQQLTTIKLLLDMAATSDRSAELAARASKAINDVINDVRHLSKSLIPSTLKDLGLIDSVNELISSICRTSPIAIDFDVNQFEEIGFERESKICHFPHYPGTIE